MKSLHRSFDGLFGNWSGNMLSQWNTVASYRRNYLIVLSLQLSEGTNSLFSRLRGYVFFGGETSLEFFMEASETLETVFYFRVNDSIALTQCLAQNIPHVTVSAINCWAVILWRRIIENYRTMWN